MITVNLLGRNPSITGMGVLTPVKIQFCPILPLGSYFSLSSIVSNDTLHPTNVPTKKSKTNGRWSSLIVASKFELSKTSNNGGIGVRIKSAVDGFFDGISSFFNIGFPKLAFAGMGNLSLAGGFSIFGDGLGVSHVAQMSGNVYTGIGNQPEKVDYDAFVNILELKGYNKKEQDAIRLALDILDAFPDIIKRNLYFALKMLDWAQPVTSIVASILYGTPRISPSVNNSILKRASRLLDGLNELYDVACNWTDGDRVKNVREMMFLVASSIDEMLMLAGLDFARLMNVKPQSNDRNDLRMISSRAFYVTSWILKFAGFSEDGANLENLGFLHLNPDDYDKIEKHLVGLFGLDRAESLNKLRTLAENISDILSEDELSHRIKYRIKTAASAMKRLNKKGNNRDTNGMRIILGSQDVGDCYKALEDIRIFMSLEGWHEKTDEFDDYIYVKPKSNGYKSLHVYFYDDSNYLVEMQIRTESMDMYAEFGPANHGDYKVGESAKAANGASEVFDASNRFNTKREALLDAGVAFVYARDGGKLFKLVTGERNLSPTALDFAFAVSPKLGMNAYIAEINGKKSKLGSTLSVGDTVNVDEGKVKRLRRKKRLFNMHTPYARTIFELLYNNEQLSSDQLDTQLDAFKRYGRIFLDGIVSSVSKEFHKYYHLFKRGVPTFGINYDNMASSIGLGNIDQMLIVLGSMSLPRQRVEIVKGISNYLRNNVVVYSHARKRSVGFFNVLIKNNATIISEAIKRIYDGGLSITFITYNKKKGSDFAFISMKYSGPADSGEVVLKSLYEIIPERKKYQPDFRRSLRLTITIGANFDKAKALQNIMEKIFQMGGTIQKIDAQEVSRRRSAEYKLSVLLPKKRNRNISPDVLRNALNGIRAVRSFSIIR